jgi:FixJ family two-component response regulator
MMPEMTGPQLYRQLLLRLPQLRVVYISGYAGPDLAYQDVLIGGIQLLEKPFSVSQLAETLRSALAGPPGPEPTAC